MFRRIRHYLSSFPDGAGWILFDTVMMFSLVLGFGGLFWALLAVLRETGVVASFMHITQALPQALDSFSPTQALDALQLPVLIGSLLFMALFYIPYRHDLGLGAIRDALVVLLFTAFTALLFSKLGLYPLNDGDMQLDAILLTGACSTFLVISISNFGGLNSDNKEVAIDFGMTLLIVAGAESLGMLWGNTPAGVIARSAVDLAVVYVLGFCAKILLFPSELLTIRIQSPLGRTLFSLASVLFLLPVVGMALSLLGVGVYALIRMATGGPEVVFAFPPFAPEIPVMGSVAYLAGLFATAPLAALGILLATVRYVVRFAEDQSLDSEMPAGIRHRAPTLGILAAVWAILAVLIVA